MRLPTRHHRPPAAGHRALRSLVAGLAAAAFAPAALADVLSVPGDFATIQAAVNAAADGDVIEIAPGDWAEAIGATPVRFEDTDPPPFFNINTPEDLARAEGWA